MAIIEGDIEGKLPGYTVHISSDPEHTFKRAEAQGIEVGYDKILIMSRIHRMNPEPDSPYLANFKAAYSKQGKYLLILVSLVAGSPNPTPHFDLAIGKTEIHFRRVEDVRKNEADAAIFVTPE